MSKYKPTDAALYRKALHYATRAFDGLDGTSYAKVEPFVLDDIADDLEQAQDAARELIARIQKGKDE